MTARKLTLGFAAAAILAWCLWPGQEILVTIPSGSSATQTAALLKEKGVIDSISVFREFAELRSQDRKIKPGIYRLRAHMWAFRALQAVGSLNRTGVKVTIPEGFSARQIAERLEAEGICPAADFERYESSHGLEGYLFPATYYLQRDSAPEEAARQMLDEFSRQIAPVYDGMRPKPRMTLAQVLTLASIVEREAERSREKPMIAAVYLNRLQKRMLLGADPTVQYALGYWKKGLTLADLKTDSPYNTYVHYGLPPGPICSPGVDSFTAVLHPAETKALYFVADARGGHTFWETGEEHLKAKRLFKKRMRAKQNSTP